MLTGEARRKLAFLAAFLLPIGVVKLTGALLGTSGPSSAAASTIPEPIVDPTVIARPRPGWSPAQLTAAAYIDAVGADPVAPSPLLYSRVETGVSVEPVEQPDELDFEVSLIMASGSGNVALINGSPYRVGDVVLAPWAIERIDGETRSVTFVNTKTDDRHIASVPKPY